MTRRSPELTIQNLFSDSYHEARLTFIEEVTRRGAQLWSERLACSTPSCPLSIDVARLGPSGAAQVLVLSSGTHGVEGFFGSAVQLAALTHSAQALEEAGLALVLIHAVNPYGFAKLRRVNEDNVDLNRNFLGADERYSGADPGYVALDPLLNPTTPPQRLEFFWFKALIQLALRGSQALKTSIAQGQYDFERGLFYGGAGPSHSHELIRQHLPAWLEGATKVVHIDLHTGLGPWGDYVLAASQAVPSGERVRLMSHFDADRIQPPDRSELLYPVRGELMSFCRSMMSECHYYPVLAEFGTYSALRVLQALREENRATHWCSPGSAELTRARAQLREVFCPRSPRWRSRATRAALRVIDQAAVALSSSALP